MLTTPLIEIKVEENGDLHIKVANSGIDELRYMKEQPTKPSLDIWEALLESYSTNGSYTLIPPEVVGALTDAPIITDHFIRGDFGMDFEDGTDGTKDSVGNVWWFPDFMVRDELDELLEGKTVVFTKAATWERDEEKPKRHMKTSLPPRITTLIGAKALLLALHENGESYHPEDDATAMDNANLFTLEEGTKLNSLMAQMYDLIKTTNFHPGYEFDPCEFIKSLDTMSAIDKVHIKIFEAASTEEVSLYWSQGDEISTRLILKALEEVDDKYDEPKAAYFDLYNTIEDMNTDSIFDCELEIAEKLVKNFEDDIVTALNVADDDFDTEDYARMLLDNCLRDYFEYDLGIDSILKQTPINIRVEMFSNYDCINSHFFEAIQGGGYSGNQSYFSDMIKMLGLNPQKVKAMLIEKECRVNGNWSRRDDSNAQVSYEDLWQELQNNSGSANLLTYVAQVDAYELLTHNLSKCTIVIPKGNQCGIFSSACGGGSMMEMTLLRDVSINLGKRWDGGYLGFRLVPDDAKKYSCKDVYGVANSFFGGEATLISPEDVPKRKYGKKIRTITYTLFEHWASALISGDWSGYTDKEEAEIKAFIADKGSCIDVSEERWFAHKNDASNLGGDVKKYFFTVPTKQKDAGTK
jgi:hypothetical protein